MTQKERYAAVISWFEANMPDPRTELHYDSPFQLLVAVILSAQCTDKRVNLVTPAIFRDFPTPEALAAATFDQLQPYVASVSYPNNKTRLLIGMATRLVGDYGGRVPDNIDDLLSLPGVGRKTANVILSVVFGKAAMAVDTHVFRVSERLGLTTRSRNPHQTELALMRHIPAEIVPRAHHWLILHGRYVCKARRPDCLNCGLSSVCRFYASASRTSNQ